MIKYPENVTALSICAGPIAVGRALLSSEEMISSGMKGKGLEVLHVFRDQLW